MTPIRVWNVPPSLCDMNHINWGRKKKKACKKNVKVTYLNYKRSLTDHNGMYGLVNYAKVEKICTSQCTFTLNYMKLIFLLNWTSSCLKAKSCTTRQLAFLGREEEGQLAASAGWYEFSLPWGFLWSQTADSVIIMSLAHLSLSPLVITHWVWWAEVFLTAFMAQVGVTPSHAANSKRASYSGEHEAKVTDEPVAKASWQNQQSSTPCSQCCQTDRLWIWN